MIDRDLAPGDCLNLGLGIWLTCLPWCCSTTALCSITHIENKTEDILHRQLSHLRHLLLGITVSYQEDEFNNGSRGRILGWNIDKRLKSFLPCSSQSTLQLCLEISISSNSLNLVARISRVELLYTVKEKGEKPDRKPYPLPWGLRNPYRNLKSKK